VKIDGAQILLRSLKEEGVDTMFGCPGRAVIDIFDALVTKFHEVEPVIRQALETKYTIS